MRRNVEKRESLMNATPSIWPVYGWLSAGYGMRADPFTGERDFHPGLDISAEKGTPILATAAGRVEVAAPSGDYGNLVVVDHGYGLVTRYGHLSKFAVWQGREVKRGDVIGYIGATGRATGPHLHYEVLANGKLINPLQLLGEQGQRGEWGRPTGPAKAGHYVPDAYEPHEPYEPHDPTLTRVRIVGLPPDRFPMLGTLLAKVIGTQNERELKRLRPLVDKVNAFEPALKQLVR